MLLAVKVTLLVAALVVLLRLKVDLALTILILAAATILLFQVPLLASLETAGRTLVAGDTLEVLAVIVLVQYIGNIQKKHGMFDRLINSLNRLFRDRRLVAIVSPAIIGFLPMPGGALFSAPLVEASTCEMKLQPAFNAFLNYWFRHDWELIWPLYVGLLLFQKMSRIPLRTIILYQLPFSLLHIATGLAVAFLYFRRHRILRQHPAAEATSNHHRAMLADFAAGTWPLLTVILLFFILQVPLYLALIGVALTLSLLVRVRPGEAARLISTPTIVRSIFVVAAVMIFQEIIKISRAFGSLPGMGLSLGLVVLFIFLVSFTVGFLTGVNTAYIAIAMPVLLPLIQQLSSVAVGLPLPGLPFPLPLVGRLPGYLWLSLYTYVIGFAGILASPVHLCLVLTNEYFRAPLLAVYRYMIFPLLAMMGLSTLLVLVLR